MDDEKGGVMSNERSGRGRKGGSGVNERGGFFARRQQLFALIGQPEKQTEHHQFQIANAESGTKQKFKVFSLSRRMWGRKKSQCNVGDHTHPFK